MEKFNWYEQLSKPEISNHEWVVMNTKASSWVTCAVGNLCDIIPRSDSGEPEDKILLRYGVQFMEYVCERNVDKSIETLNKIENRSKMVINRIQKKP